MKTKKYEVEIVGSTCRTYYITAESAEKAEEMALNIGCEGFHIHEFEGKEWYMPCKEHIKK